MKAALTIFTVVLLIVLTGCHPRVEEKEPLIGGKRLLTVDFQKGQTLRYKFVSSKEIEVNWDPTKRARKSGKDIVDKSSESVNMVVSYTPVEVDPYGLTTIKATCESVKIKRSSQPGRRAGGKDAVERLSGKTFTLTVSPTGKIEDYSQLDELIREIGKKAFRKHSRMGRIKEPDMIWDFITTQWFLWDSISSIEKAIEGVSVGQTWKSKLSVPAPMVIREARDVTYTLDEIRESEKGQLAVIRSSYSLSESVPQTWPIPYSGKFQMSATFGFLRDYKVLDLQGEGEELFNIDAGQTEQYNQQYKMELEASLPMAIGAKPRITINQKLTMKLLGDSDKSQSKSRRKSRR